MNISATAETAAGRGERHEQTTSFPFLSWSGAATAAGLLAAPMAAQAGPSFTISPTLNPGDHYRILFVTAATTTAASSSIATYNSFVATAAANNPLLPLTTWTVIGSTSTVNAAANIACAPSCANDPIFLVSGTKIAASITNFFSGTILSPINTFETGGSTSFPYVWTGSNTDGTASATPLGGANVSRGSGSATTLGSYLDNGSFASSFGNSLYGISGDLVVPGVGVPGPAGAGLFGFGALMTVFARFRRARRGS